MRLVTVLFPSFSHIQLALASPLEPPVWFWTPEVPAAWIRPVNRPSWCLGTAGCWGFIWVMSEDLSTHRFIWDMFWLCLFLPLSCDLSLLHWTLMVLFQFGCKSVQVLTTEWINFSMKGECTSLTYKVNFRAFHSQIMSIYTSSIQRAFKVKNAIFTPQMCIWSCIYIPQYFTCTHYVSLGQMRPKALACFQMFSPLFKDSFEYLSSHLWLTRLKIFLHTISSV